MVINVPGKNVTFTNSDIIQESVELNEVLENDGYLTFKGCKSTQFKFQVANIIQDLRGEYIEVTLQANNTDIIPIFSGYIDAQTNLTHQDVVTQFTAYDPLYKVGGTEVIEWLNNLTFPISMASFRQSLFTFLGIDVEENTLPTDAMQISSAVKSVITSATAEQMLQWICQVNGRYGVYGRDKKFHFKQLKQITAGTYPALDLYPSEETYPSGENAEIILWSGSDYISINYEPYKAEQITAVTIYDAKGNVGGSAGSGINVFNVQDNPIAYAMSMTDLVATLFDEVKHCEFTPLNELKVPGMPWAEVGDIVVVGTTKNTVRSYILNRHMTGVQAVFDEFESKSDQYQPEFKQTTTTKVSANTSGVAENKQGLIQANQLIADRATIAQLQATNARVGSLEADHVSVNSFNALSGTVNDLSAIAITTQNLSAQRISANQISGGTLSGSYIRGGTISGVTLSLSGGYFYYGSSQCVWDGADVMFADGTTGHINFMSHN